MSETVRNLWLQTSENLINFSHKPTVFKNVISAEHEVTNVVHSFRGNDNSVIGISRRLNPRVISTVFRN
jgi:hypothetical protein